MPPGGTSRIGLTPRENRGDETRAARLEHVLAHVERQRILESGEDYSKVVSQVVQPRLLLVQVRGIDLLRGVLNEQFLYSMEALVDLTGALQPELGSQPAVVQVARDEDYLAAPSAPCQTCDCLGRHPWLHEAPAGKDRKSTRVSSSH